jgi:hypothetical protein
MIVVPEANANRSRLHEQLDELRANLQARPSGAGFELGVEWTDDGREVQYLYRQDMLLCDAGDLDAVLAAFDAIGEPRPTPEQISDGPVHLKVIDTSGRHADRLAQALSRQLGDDQIVTPNYVVDTTGKSAVCPAADPLPWEGPVSAWPEPEGSGRPTVAVIDTGYDEESAKASGFKRFKAVGDFERDDEVYFGTSKDIRPYGGHGTAATACLLAVSGGNSINVRVRDILVGGGADELSIIEDLETVVKTGVDVVSLQGGMYTRGAREPRSFINFRRYVLAHDERTVILAAAGNDGEDRPFWPAAFSWCTAVGALTKGGDARAAWSNLGHWVDVYATGEAIVVPYPDGRLRYPDGTKAQFSRAHAVWSGTSFATPYVAGLVARRMIERDVTARHALQVVLQEARDAALPNTGPRIVI